MPPKKTTKATEVVEATEELVIESTETPTEPVIDGAGDLVPDSPPLPYQDVTNRDMNKAFAKKQKRNINKWPEDVDYLECPACHSLEWASVQRVIFQHRESGITHKPRLPEAKVEDTGIIKCLECGLKLGPTAIDQINKTMYNQKKAGKA